MLYIMHRVNTIKQLKSTPARYGVELDIRGFDNKLLLNHNPIVIPSKHDELENYLKHFKHAFAVFNVKEAGYESRVIALAKKYKIKNYFLLDVEFPYLYKATRKDKIKNIAIRYSEAEPIESVEAQIKNGRPLLNWVWIDTNTRLPLTAQIVKRLRPFKTCLVCPSRWGRRSDIIPYIKKMRQLKFSPNAIMTSAEEVKIWELNS